jgi:hypothetical protein
MKLQLSVICLFITFSVSARYVEPVKESNNCRTIGILQGGGSFIGFDYETLLGKQLGVQVGAGMFAMGGGINYHFKESIKSSFISLQYWHQGFGQAYIQSLMGPNFVYRGKRWFTAQLGIGYVIDSRKGYSYGSNQSPVMLMYSIGVYFN